MNVAAVASAQTKITHHSLETAVLPRAAHWATFPSRHDGRHGNVDYDL